MIDYNGHAENHTIREYENVSEIPSYIIEDLGINPTALMPVFVLFVDGCFDGMFESKSDALDASQEKL